VYPLLRAGVKEVDVLIKRNKDTTFWNNPGWSSEPVSWPTAKLSGVLSSTPAFTTGDPAYFTMPQWQSGEYYNIP